MTRVVALLAAVVAFTLLVGCGEDRGAEPGASREATLVLDFTPNAVHAGIYAALARDYFDQEGIELRIRQPSTASDAPKLLQAGRTEFAILDINDLGIARERGLDLVAAAAIVQVPLASVIAGDRREIRRPRDLEGTVVGVTGLPSDDAVLDAVVRSDGGDPGEVDRITIGFDSVPALRAERLDAATAFWNAEGVALRGLGLPTREFRVAEAAGDYPELVVTTTAALRRSDPELVDGMVNALARGYEETVDNPDAALADLLTAVPGLEEQVQEAQLRALLATGAFGEPPTVEVTAEGADAWLEFAIDGGLVSERLARERDGMFGLAND